MKAAARASVLGLLLLTGCASIVSRSSADIAVRSIPASATVTITSGSGQDVYVGKTPAIATVPTGDGFFVAARYTVRVSLEGYDDQLFTIGSRLNAWYFGNLLLGGLIGMVIVDPLTGAMWTLSPTSVNASLNKKTSALDQGQRSIEVVLLQSVPQELRSKMVRLR